MAETQYMLTSTPGGKKEWIPVSTGGGAMIYPSAGIPISNGSGWITSISNNSTNWNTAYGWGNHAGLYRPVAWMPSYSEVGACSSSDSRLSDSRVASDVYAWAKASVKPSYGVAEISGAAPLASPSFTGTGSWDSPTFCIDSINHRVGINTNVPAVRFDVHENADAWVGRFYQKSTTLGNGLQVRSDNVGDLTAPVLATYSNSAYQFWVACNGNVGIGTVSPAEKLHVVGNGKFTGDVVAYAT